MPNGHLSGARRAFYKPGGYSLHTNFRERRKGELRILGILGSSQRKL